MGRSRGAHAPGVPARSEFRYHVGEGWEGEDVNEARGPSELAGQFAISAGDLDRAVAKVLRLVLAQAPSPLPQHELRAKAFARADGNSSSSSNIDKCLLDLAVLQLVEQEVLIRHGYGNWALYSVPEHAARTAAALAFAEFPSDEASAEDIMSLTYQAHPARTPCGVTSLRRNPSPRRRGSRDKALRPRSAQKRSADAAADVAAALQKKMRVGSGGGGGWVSSMSSGPAPMSP